MNVVMLGKDRRRAAFVEVQGTAEGSAVQPRRARRAARRSPAAGSPRSWRCRPRWSPSRRRRARSADDGACMQLVCASANPDKVAEIAAILDGVVELLPAAGGRARCGRGRRHADRQRPAEGGGDLRGDRPAGGQRRHRSVRRRPRRARPASTRRGTRARTRRTPTTAPSCSRAGRRSRRPARQLQHRVMVVGRTASELAVEGVCPGTIARPSRGSRLRLRPGVHPRRWRRPTFAQMTDDEKNQISHRARAFNALLEALRTR